MAGAAVRDILVPGPWRHQDVAANGIRFHVATGASFGRERPLVLLLHGFGQFWWAWRHQIPVLDQAGYDVAAMDLRGYGASDKTPHGYDPRNTAADIASVIRSLGHRGAVLVGHDWGGVAAWSTAAYAPEQVNRLVIVSAPHPLGILWSGGSGQLTCFQVPRLPERRLVADHGAFVEQLLRRQTARPDHVWSSADALRYREALLQWPSARCALAYHRAFLRHQLSGAGLGYRRALRVPVRSPLLSVHGEADRLLPRAALARGALHVDAANELASLPQVGHLPHEEAPEAFNEILLRWLAAAR